ncbi:MAG: 2-iminoacetate synthase ThiH, partial [Planctomycetota bacterium]|nr:2-iminoacetate synthase ThiH [Planctomycetota bacterium]
QLNELMALMDSPRLQSLLENRDSDRVRAALHRPNKRPEDLALMLSPGADSVIEEIAQEAKRISRERFGFTIGLFAPLYLSNICVGKCSYCGFRADLKIKRRTLTQDEIKAELDVVASYGIRDVLLVSGETPRNVSTEYMEQAIRSTLEVASSVSMEIAPVAMEDYRAMRRAGATGLTLYQETYDQDAYNKVHFFGPKGDFMYRLEALDRAGEAGLRKLTAGALFGLSHWRLEGLRLGLHAAYLQKRWWESQISIGLPRLKGTPENFDIPKPIDDRTLVHLLIVMRVFLPDVGISISTRETPEFRKNVLGLGVTQMSAGSKTEPGGYTEANVSGDQFSISDERLPKEVAEDLLSMGYDPVWKDWDRSFVSTV